MFSSVVYFILFILIILAILLYDFFFGKEAVFKGKIKNARSVKISEFKDGDIARISGKIKLVSEPLIAPLSGNECSYYSVTVSEHSTKSYSDIIKENMAGDVVIFDGSDYAVINTKAAKTHIVRSAAFSPDLSNIKSYLKKHGKESKNMFGMNRNLLIKESLLQENHTLFVVGKGRWLQKEHISINIPAEKVLFIGFDKSEPVYFTDDILLLQ